VTRSLSRSLNSQLIPQSSAYGKAFEHFLILEIRNRSDYLRNDWQFFYLRTKDDVEIDLIIDRPGHPTACIEIKSTTHVREDHLTSFNRISRDLSNSVFFCFSLDPNEKTIGNISCLHWQAGLKRLGL
jgi:predicted AAA+ superfamily ATPase